MQKTVQMFSQLFEVYSKISSLVSVVQNLRILQQIIYSKIRMSNPPGKSMSMGLEEDNAALWG